MAIICMMLFIDSFGQSKYGPNDTLLVPVIIYNGDTLPFRELDYVIIAAKMTEAQRQAFRKWTRLRNAVYVTYPYARQASYIINEINFNLGGSMKRKKAAVYKRQGSRTKEKICRSADSALRIPGQGPDETH